jgi:hypothetical protein
VPRLFFDLARLRLCHRADIGELHLVVPGVKLDCIALPVDGDDEADPQVGLLSHPVRQAEVVWTYPDLERTR